jgi:hypothetical protein
VGAWVTTAGESGPLVEVFNGVDWSSAMVAAPNFAYLAAVSCPAPTQCVAVGGAGLIATWDGSDWTTQELSGEPPLVGVSCPSLNVCVAVGDSPFLSSSASTFAAAWNGTSWTTQATPGGQLASGSSSFSAVSCGAATTCTAVGEGFITAQADGALGVDWNGSAWLRQNLPEPIGGALSGVACTAPTACVAVGHRSTPPDSPSALPFVERSS